MEIIKKYICPFCNKEYDNPYKLGGHKTKCNKNPKYKEYIEKWKQSFNLSMQNGFNNFNENQILYCQFCGKECNSLNSLKQHEIRCKENPNHIEVNFNWIKCNKNKNKNPSNQYIKAKNEGYELKMSEETKRKIALIWLGKKHKNETKELIQKTIQQNIENNNWHNNNGIKIKYNNEIFDSSWEVEFVKYLDLKNIKWERPKKSFNYYWNNANHKYYPDIYLPEYNLYIEIKGIPNERDYAKWNQFPEKIDIYDCEDLYNLGILNSFDKRCLIKEEYKYKNLILGSVV